MFFCFFLRAAICIQSSAFPPLLFNTLTFSALSVFSSQWSGVSNRTAVNNNGDWGQQQYYLHILLKMRDLNSVGEDLRRRREQEDKVLLCLEWRETINGEKMMALGRGVNSDKALCWKKVPSNPYNFSCSTAMKRCTSKQLFCQSWQTTQFFWKRPMVEWVTHTNKAFLRQSTTIRRNVFNPVLMFFWLKSKNSFQTFNCEILSPKKPIYYFCVCMV